MNYFDIFDSLTAFIHMEKHNFVMAHHNCFLSVFLFFKISEMASSTSCLQHSLRATALGRDKY